MSSMTPSIAMVAGEASGDLQGALLAARLREMIPSVRIWGVGGPKMRDAGVKVVHDSSSWSAIGAAEALKAVPRLLLAFFKLASDLKSDPPDLLVLIDFGVFNLKVGRYLRPNGAKVLYYFPPTSWYRGTSYEKLEGIADAVVTPFPWSARTLEKQGFCAEFFGHPVLDSAKPSLSREDFCRQFGLEPQRQLVGLLPGSRAHEVEHNLPALVLAAGRLRESMPDLQFAVPLAPSISVEAVAQRLRRIPWLEVGDLGLGSGSASTEGSSRHLSLVQRIRTLSREDGFPEPAEPVRVRLLSGMAHDVLAHSRAAVVTSGTATLEAAVLGCPMVIIYRGTRLSALEFKLRGRKIKFIGMPNIIADELVCPELIHRAASPSRITELMVELLADSPERRAMLTRLADVRAYLGSPGAVEKTAGVILKLLGLHPSDRCSVN